MEAYIFVCYSRDDERLVTQVVRLLRAAVASVPSVTGNHWQFVYQDLDHIPPGADWEAHIDDAIGRAERVFVFWCHHAARSEQVKREVQLAAGQAKIIVPVLLDEAPLASYLARSNGVDLRSLGSHLPQGQNLVGAGGRGARDIIAAAFAPTLGIARDAMERNLAAYDPHAD